jgi:hypothetical protein
MRKNYIDLIGMRYSAWQIAGLVYTLVLDFALVIVRTLYSVLVYNETPLLYQPHIHRSACEELTIVDKPLTLMN